MSFRVRSAESIFRVFVLKEASYSKMRQPLFVFFPRVYQFATERKLIHLTVLFALLSVVVLVICQINCSSVFVQIKNQLLSLDFHTFHPKQKE